MSYVSPILGASIRLTSEGKDTKDLVKQSLDDLRSLIQYIITPPYLAEFFIRHPEDGPRASLRSHTDN